MEFMSTIQHAHIISTCAFLLINGIKRRQDLFNYHSLVISTNYSVKPLERVSPDIYSKAPYLTMTLHTLAHAFAVSYVLKWFLHSIRCSHFLFVLPMPIIPKECQHKRWVNEQVYNLNCKR